MRVEVRAQARLHFGFLDLSGEKGRRFGGMGVSISVPRLLLKMEPSKKLAVEGDQAERVEILAARFCDAVDLRPEARIQVVEGIPEHVGLGSGTQLALAVAAGLSRLHGLDVSAEELCALMNRARRSGVGYHLFQRGGFVIEGGHAVENHKLGEAPPLLMRHEFPEDWRIVVAIPKPKETVSGEAEEAAFSRLGPPSESMADQISRIVLMRLLPALVERDLDVFGAALTQAQELVGSCFAAVQNGLFHPDAAPLITRLKEAGARGVGQSSWGPAVYAFAASEEEERRLLDVARRAATCGSVFGARGWNRGAAIESA
jgi:beta-ribofuranosylaminobenzene 5'-phosphate synthase